jgi:hypothetical protein
MPTTVASITLKAKTSLIICLKEIAVSLLFDYTGTVTPRYLMIPRLIDPRVRECDYGSS